MSFLITATAKPTSNTTQPNNRIAHDGDAQRKQASSRTSPDLRIEYSEERPPTHGDQPPRLGLNFTEAAGKVIAFVNVINDPPNWQALEIRFTDRTLLHVEFGSAPTQIKPTYVEARHGNLELMRSYGTLLTDDERTDRERVRGGDDDRPYSQVTTFPTLCLINVPLIWFGVE